MKHIPKKIPEGINSSTESPLTDALYLTALTAIFIGGTFFLLGLFTDSVVKKIDLASEAKYFQEIASEDADEKRDTVQALVDQLWSHYPESENLKVHVNTIDSNEINAFMKIGGNLSVTTGLLEHLQHENDLAFVVCHEIGHFYNRDVLNGMGRQLGVAFFLASLGLSNSVEFLNMGTQSLSLAFSRKQESRADQFALECMHRHYGHVKGYDAFFKIIVDKDLKIPKTGKRVLSFTQTHPMTENRIEKLQKQIQKAGYKDSGELIEKQF